MTRRFRLGLILVKTKLSFLAYSLALVDHILEAILDFLIPEYLSFYRFFSRRLFLFTPESRPWIPYFLLYFIYVGFEYFCLFGDA